MKLDGSYCEGGGQILRTAVALSAVTGEPVEIYNIRKMRPKPGLAAQHVKAIESVASICDAEVEGCSLHSTRLSFKPGKIKGGVYEIDIGTAGSITLLLQCLMPVALKAPSSITLKVTGGTDVSWSPPVDHLRFVTLRALERMGYSCDVSLLRRGYYPRGGGYVEATINPSALRGADFEKNICNVIEGISHSSGLPAHVVQRQAASAEKVLNNEGYETRLSLEVRNEVSTGSGITLWCGTASGSALGRPGLKAEKVGGDAAESILSELKSGAGVDIYLADQLIPYMALAGSGSLVTRTITPHARTNIWVTEQFLDVKFNIQERERLFRISIP
ncbi:MAG: RNA 3'-terminal phosphate cyclase [Candidatus Methanoperedens sp.]|nr:RNA 3'-terminal phosphate cyclase [Candidatus Methanoperedens sp.]